MNISNQYIIDLLSELKENYNVIGVKTEFEAEGATLEEAYKLKHLADKTGLDYHIKIGGCEAIRDMLDIKPLNVNAIIAPMIESAYSLVKYIQALESVFADEELARTSLMINIETITGFNNFKEITSSPYIEKINGIVIGRADLTASMNMAKESVNSDIILNLINDIAPIVTALNKELCVGGGISTESVQFFKQIPANLLSKFETRKIIFDAQNALNNPNIYTGIEKAIEFEILSIQNQIDNCNTQQRLLFLKNRHKTLLQKNTKIYT